MSRSMRSIGPLARRAGAATVLLLLALGSLARADAPVRGVVGKEVSLGAWAPETGPATALYATGQGAVAYFRWLNEHGGIDGYRFRMTLVNDQYDPALTPAAVRRLVNVDRVFAIVAGIGTPSNLAAMSYMVSVGIPDVAPASGDPALTHPFRKNVFSVVPSYVSEGAFQAAFALDRLHAKSLAVIYENDDIGKPGLEGVTKMLASRGLRPAAAVAFDRGAVSYTPYIVRLKASGADTVVIWGAHPAFPPILKAAEAIGYHPTWVTFGFDADPNVVRQVPVDQLAKTYFDTWMPVPDGPGMAAYREAMSQFYPQSGTGMLSVQGWCLASVFATAFSRMVQHGAKPSWAGLERALESMGHISNAYVHGLSFTPSDHRALPDVYVMKYEHGRIVRVTPYLALPRL